MEKHVIEHAGLPVGVAIQENGKVKFIAVKYHVMDLDDQEFASVADLRRALSRLAAQTAPAADATVYRRQPAGANLAAHAA